MRYYGTYQTKSSSGTYSYITLDDYVKHMKQGQQKIYYAMGPTLDQAMLNPFMDAFKDSDVPVLILAHQVDEVAFQ